MENRRMEVIMVAVEEDTMEKEAIIDMEAEEGMVMEEMEKEELYFMEVLQLVEVGGLEEIIMNVMAEQVFV